jgi:glyoxylase-like metal-dependent hydrolase (beta-lactamase superfamily II)
MAYTLDVGGIRCHILSDGLNALDGGGFFGVVPRMLWERIVEPDEKNLIPADTRSLLIESNAGLILVDTGVGDKLTARQRQIIGLDDRTDRLIGDLLRIGYKPADVDTVILTHLHNDHVGGATRWENSDSACREAAATFPNARYHVQRIDLAEASFPNERTAATYFAQNWEPLRRSDQLVVVDGPQRYGSAVRTDVAPGHTGAIQTVWVEANGESLLFLGDACSWAVHMDRLAWVPSFDIFPMISIETKRRLRDEAIQRGTLLVFQHDAQVVTGRLVPGERGPQVSVEIGEEPWEDSSR